jgi:hypothetical protein
MTDAGKLDKEFLLDAFRQVYAWVYEESGIEMPPDTIRFEIYDNPRGNLSAQGRVGYRGPMGRGGDAPRVKVDLTGDEILVMDTVLQDVHHPYSDRPDNGIKISCYSFEELFAEKIRALAERERPRDLYDVVHLYRHDELKPDRGAILYALKKKCAFKNIPLPTMATLDIQEGRKELESEWGNMLGHQLPSLPAFEQFWQDLPAVFDWLYSRLEKVERPAISIDTTTVDETWQPPSMGYAWHTPVPMEGIRFAAANHLCVELTYKETSRLIEPYSLRQTRDGNLILFAVKHVTGQDRAYRVDRIEEAQVSNITFTPRYRIELTPLGPITAPPLKYNSTGRQRYGTRKPGTAPRKSAVIDGSDGPKYVFQCTIYGKKFTHTTYKATLHPHKNKQGYPCPGRVGVYVTTMN